MGVDPRTPAARRRCLRPVVAAGWRWREVRQALRHQLFARAHASLPVSGLLPVLTCGEADHPARQAPAYGPETGSFPRREGGIPVCLGTAVANQHHRGEVRGQTHLVGGVVGSGWNQKLGVSVAVVEVCCATWVVGGDYCSFGRSVGIILSGVHPGSGGDGSVF